MGFTIKYDTGNIEQDVLDTIRSFSEDELQTFIEEFKFVNETKNIHGSGIVFRYCDCEELLNSLKETDFKKVSFSDKKKIRDRTFRVDTDRIFRKVLNPFYEEIFEIVDGKIDVRERFCEIMANGKFDLLFYKRCFDILSSDEMFAKFCDFEDYLELFGSDFSQREYVLQISKMLGYKNTDVMTTNDIFKYGLVDEKMLRKYKKLRSLVNVDLEMLGEDPFDYEMVRVYSADMQAEIDNDWNVDPGLLAYVFEDMDSEYSSLEKVAHVYIKLCNALRYNMGYTVFKYDTIYRKERQEAISLEHNEVICSEFSFLCSKILNSMDGISARCVYPSNGPHMALGVMVEAENVMLRMDSTNLQQISEGDGKEKLLFDDLGRIKLGLPLVGIEHVCDREHAFYDAFNRVYSKFMENKTITAENLIAAYAAISSRRNGFVNFEENMEEFIKRMRNKNVKGSELLNVFQTLAKIGYFGDIAYAIVGENIAGTFTEKMNDSSIEGKFVGLEENVIIDNRADIENEEYYVLRLDKCQVIVRTAEELNDLFDSDKMRYYNSKYMIDGIGKDIKSTLKGGSSK